MVTFFESEIEEILHGVETQISSCLKLSINAKLIGVSRETNLITVSQNYSTLVMLRVFLI